MIAAGKQESQAELQASGSAAREHHKSTRICQQEHHGPVVRNNDNDDHSFEPLGATKSPSYPARSRSTFGAFKTGGSESDSRAEPTSMVDCGARDGDGDEEPERRTGEAKDNNREELGEQSIWCQPEMAALATSEDNMTRCERNKWAFVEPEVEWQRQQQTSGRIGLMQIVESAEQKLMMNKRAGGLAGRSSMMLLKSPAFATNTLAEDQLDSLARDSSIQADQEDDELEDRLDQRGGPTPTNEFIRSLLKRDRAALATKLASSKPEAADAPKRKPRVKVTGDDSVAGGVGYTAMPHPDDESTRAPCSDRELDKAREQDVGLSALISKCRAIQLSSSTSSGGSDSAARLARLMRPRTPSDPSPLLTASVNLAGAQLSQVRRHSTYMLPLVLDDQRRRRQAKSRSGGLDTDLSLTESSSSSPSPPPPLRVEPMVGRHQTQAGVQHLSVLGLANSLANSASSPSALSTPTNEQEPTGCGGACCAGDSSRLGSLNEQASANYDRRRGQGSPPPPLLEAGSQQSWTASKVSQRARVGSNPLDRLIRGPAGSKKGAPLGSSQTKTASAKRHSIINILHSGSPQHLVSRLSHPRALFTGSLSSSASNSTRNSLADSLNSPSCVATASNSPTGRRPSQPTDSKSAYPGAHALDSAEQHYDPLIPETGFKIVVMGTSGSGKSAIIKRFLYDTFETRHFPTVEDTYFIEFPYMKNIINISISDTSGTYQFPAMRKLAINSGDAFILVCSVDNPKSFDDLEQMRQTILEERERAYLEASMMSSCASSAACSSSNLASEGQANCLASCPESGLDYHPSSGPQVGSTKQSATTADQALSPATPGSRHWSLASLFGHSHTSLGHTNQTSLGANYANQPHPTGSSAASSMLAFASSSTGSSTADSSRRSSISAAEAALKTRRTRHPPMVIVANKCDLPPDQHLVNSDEIEALAVIDWNNGFVRASAKLSTNVDDIFQQVLRQAKQPPTLTEAIVSKRRRSLPPKLPNQMLPVT